MSAKGIEAILRPASVALVGASQDPRALGGIARRNLREEGYAGPVYLVNPRHETLSGERVYSSVLDLPQATDVALIVTPAAAVPRVFAECAERGIPGAIVVSAGFREGGEVGALLERDMIAVARRTGLR